MKGTSCKVYDAPFDVLLSKEDQSTVVQPDICVICDEDKLTEQGCTGAPDLIVEVLSPGNSTREMKDNLIYMRRMESENIGWCRLCSNL